jgi:hypothetical protein
MLQNDSICHKNASRVNQTSIVENVYNKKIPPIFFQTIFLPRMKKTVDPPL